jgi:hypothetical protein
MSEPTIDELLAETDRRMLGLMASMGAEYCRAVRGIIERYMHEQLPDKTNCFLVWFDNGRWWVSLADKNQERPAQGLPLTKER